MSANIPLIIDPRLQSSIIFGLLASNYVGIHRWNLFFHWVPNVFNYQIQFELIKLEFQFNEYEFHLIMIDYVQLSILMHELMLIYDS